MAKYNISLSCESVKTEAYDHNRLAVDLVFASSDDLFQAVKDEISATELLQDIGLGASVESIIDAHGGDLMWKELERQATALRLSRFRMPWMRLTQLWTTLKRKSAQLIPTTPMMFSRSFAW